VNTRHVLVGLAAVAGAVLLTHAVAPPAAAQLPTTLLVTVSDNLDPAASGGQVIYAVTVKNDGSTKAKDVVVTIPIPPQTGFVKCTHADLTYVETPCAVTAGVASAKYFKIPAHLEVRISLTLTMPVVSSVSTVTVEATADGDDATDDRNHADTTVLPPGSFVTYLPSGRVGAVACGTTLTPADFGTDTTAQLSGSLGCTSGAFGLKVAAPAITLDLNKFKIFWNAANAAGTVGILVSAKKVTILGGSTGGTSGIESFDWCVKDEGNAKKLKIDTVRCFRPRSAGFDLASKKVQVLNCLVDRATGGNASTTAELPGGIGIRTRGDGAHVNATIVRRSTHIGISAEGVDGDASGTVALIDGNTSTMRIEQSAGIGLLLEGGPHSVKDVYVEGNKLPGAGRDGVVVGTTGVDNVIDGVVVKKHAGNGFVVNGIGTSISRCQVEGVEDLGDDLQDGYVIAGSGSDLSGNSVQFTRHGYVVTGIDTVLESNGAEKLLGDGYVIDGDSADAAGNWAKENAGRGFVIGGNAGLFDTNTAENNDSDGIVIIGSNNTLKANRSKKSGVTGITVSGTGNAFNSNAVELSTGNEWDIGPNNLDDGSNKKNGSVFSFTAAGGVFN